MSIRDAHKESLRQIIEDLGVEDTIKLLGEVVGHFVTKIPELTDLGDVEDDAIGTRCFHDSECDCPDCLPYDWQ